MIPLCAHTIVEVASVGGGKCTFSHCTCCSWETNLSITSILGEESGDKKVGGLQLVAGEAGFERGPSGSGICCTGSCVPLCSGLNPVRFLGLVSLKHSAVHEKFLPVPKSIWIPFWKPWDHPLCSHLSLARSQPMSSPSISYLLIPNASTDHLKTRPSSRIATASPLVFSPSFFPSPPAFALFADPASAQLTKWFFSLLDWS